MYNINISCFSIFNQTTDFEGQEDKYMKICASSNLSDSNVNTCREFNSYLKKKNKDLTSQINSTKSMVSNTKANLDSISAEISTLNDEIALKEAEINYLETSISNLETSIEKKEIELKDRMYSMQSYMNNNSYIEYIFGAADFYEICIQELKVLTN